MLFLHDKSLVPQKNLERILGDLAPEITRMAVVRSSGYDEPSGFINVPFDEPYHAKIVALVDEKKQLKPQVLVLIGIGGSNLGTVAIHEALFGCCPDDANIELLCADTLDADKTARLMQRVTKTLQQGENILITVVTKSGATTETMVNAALFIDLLKQHHPNDYQNYVVMITDHESPLWVLSEKNGYTCLEIPKKIGGRYSVFSAVGLFPLALLGVDIKQLCAGARQAVENSLQKNVHNHAAVGATLLFYHDQNGVKVHDTFLFDDALESLGTWYRQLMAESLGKDDKGMLPTVSMGTVDLHSMVQLYLGGARMSFTTFVATKSDHDFVVPDGEISQAAGSSVVKIQRAIFEGVQATYAQEKLPFATIADVRKSPHDIGYFLQVKMFETIYLGYLMRVNPFDQPQVELYKQQVRKRLK